MATAQTTRRTTSRSGGKRPGRPRKKSQSLPRVILSLLALSWVGRACLVSLLIVGVTGFNLLISRNQYDLFFLMVGIELIVAACIGWLLLAFRRS